MLALRLGLYTIFLIELTEVVVALFAGFTDVVTVVVVGSEHACVGCFFVLRAVWLGPLGLFVACKQLN